jgi:DNA helicase-2/ATP-dependent DNA helicase PcrA
MKIPEKAKYYFDFGSTIHNIAEQLTRMQKEGQAVDEAVAYELLAKFWNSEGYDTDVDEKRDYDEARKILKVFLEEQNKSKSVILDIERWFETAIGNVRIRGRIDRIDKDKTGFTVIDYKTSKSVPSLNELKKDLQLLVYALAVRDMYGNKSQLEVGEWFLRSNKKVFFNPEEQAIEDIQAEIQEIAKKINAAEFGPTKDKWECSQCDYKCLCD